MRLRTQSAWAIAFAAAFLLIAARVYWHQQPMFENTATAISSDNTPQLQRVGRLRLDGIVRFDRSGDWILGTHHNRVVGISTVTRRTGFEVVNNANCSGIFAFNCIDPSQVYMGTTSMSLLSPDGTHFVTYWSTGENQGLNLWHMGRGTPVARHDTRGGTSLLTFTPDSRALLFDVPQTGLWAYDIPGERYLRLHAHVPTRLIATSQRVYYQTADAIRMVDDNLEVQFVAPLDIVPGVEPYMSADGRYILGQDSSDMSITLLDQSSGARAVLEGHESSLHDVRFAADGRYLATADYSGIVMVWSIPDGTLVHRFVQPGVGAHSLAFTIDSSLLFASNYYTLRAYAVADGAVRFEERLADRNFNIQLSADGRYLLTEGGRMYGVQD